MANAVVLSVGKGAAADGEKFRFQAGFPAVYKSNSGFCGFVRFELCECYF